MSVAKVYAKTLYETATGPKAGQAANAAGLVQIEEQLTAFAKLLDSSRDLHMSLCGPIATTKEKTGIVEAIAKKIGATELVTRFLVLLATKDRLAALTLIAAAFGDVRVQSEGGVVGQVVVADPIEAFGAADLESLSRAFTKKLGKKVHFTVSSDPTLLAGMKVTVSGTTYDGSLRAQLQRLHDQLVLSHPAS